MHVFSPLAKDINYRTRDNASYGHSNPIVDTPSRNILHSGSASKSEDVDADGACNFHTMLRHEPD